MHPPPAKSSLLSWIQQEPRSTPFQQDLPQNQSNQQLGSLNSIGKSKSRRQRPFSRSNPSSLLERLSPQIRSSSLPFQPISPSLMTLTSSLLSRITPEGLQSHKPLTSPSHLRPLLSRIEGNQSLMLSSSPPHPSLETPGGSTPLSQSQEMLKKGQKSTIGPQSMRSSSLGEAPQQCFEQGLSQKCSSVSTSLMTGQQIPPMLLERSSSLLDVQTSPLTSGSTLSRDMQLTLPKSLELTIPLMSTQNSPRTLGICSRSPLECPSSPKPSRPMETGSLHLERPFK